MRFLDYCKDRIELLLMFSSELLLLSLFLGATGYDRELILLIVIAQLVSAGIAFAIGYGKRKRYFDELDNILNQMDKRYLIAEVMQNSHRYEDKAYRNILRRSNKAVIEKIHDMEQEQKDYREYIESWIHEVKTPLTTMNLICENHKDETTRKLLTETAKVDNLVEMALFYARADHVHQDYLIRETSLYETVTNVLQKNRQSLMLKRIAIDILFDECIVLTDAKWLEFIINQIVLNAMKYTKQVLTSDWEENEYTPCITFSTEHRSNQQNLIICDNGIGIPDHEIARVFEKGFTGSNGRKNKKSTGIGLYLCKKLCDKLGIGLAITSKEGSNTKVILTFPDSSLPRSIFQNCKIHESKTDTSEQ